MENKQNKSKKIEIITTENDTEELTNDNPFEEYILEKSEKFFEFEKSSGILN